MRYEKPLLPVGDQHLAAKDIPNRVRKLRDFLGGARVDRALQHFRLSLQSSGPIYREYYVKSRHPWWGAWTDFESMVKSGARIYSGLPPSIMKLGRDAHIISILQRTMPETVREKYRSALLADEASSHLFEIEIAWPFHLEGFTLEWSENTLAPGYEFTAARDGRRLNVECKAIACDSARRIKRADFYRLLDGIVPRLSERSLKGRLEIELEESLPHNDQELARIGDVILERASSGRGSAECFFGRATWDLSNVSGEPVDLQDLYSQMWSRRPPEAECAVCVRATGAHAADPIEITTLSRKSSSVIAVIQERLSTAAQRQLPSDEPGMIACFIPEIPSFEEIGGNTALSAMVTSLFAKERFGHVVAIVFTSDPRASPIAVGHKIDTPVLVYMNRRTAFPDAVQDVDVTIKD